MSEKKSSRMILSPSYKDKENWVIQNKRQIFLTPKSDNKITIRNLVFQENPRQYVDSKLNYPACRILPPLKPTLHRPIHVHQKKLQDLRSSNMLTVTFSCKKIGQFLLKSE